MDIPSVAIEVIFLTRLTELFPGVPLAAFTLDPLVSMYDLWALALQMEEYFATGPGSDRFGDMNGLGMNKVEKKIVWPRSTGPVVGVRAHDSM